MMSFGGQWHDWLMVERKKTKNKNNNFKRRM